MKKLAFVVIGLSICSSSYSMKFFGWGAFSKSNRNNKVEIVNDNSNNSNSDIVDGVTKKRNFISDAEEQPSKKMFLEKTYSFGQDDGQSSRIDTNYMIDEKNPWTNVKSNNFQSIPDEQNRLIENMDEDSVSDKNETSSTDKQNGLVENMDEDSVSDKNETSSENTSDSSKIITLLQDCKGLEIGMNSRWSTYFPSSSSINFKDRCESFQLKRKCETLASVPNSILSDEEKQTVAKLSDVDKLTFIVPLIVKKVAEGYREIALLKYKGSQLANKVMEQESKSKKQEEEIELLKYQGSQLVNKVMEQENKSKEQEKRIEDLVGQIQELTSSGSKNSMDIGDAIVSNDEPSNEKAITNKLLDNDVLDIHFSVDEVEFYKTKGLDNTVQQLIFNNNSEKINLSVNEQGTGSFDINNLKYEGEINNGFAQGNGLFKVQLLSISGFFNRDVLDLFQLLSINCASQVSFQLNEDFRKNTYIQEKISSVFAISEFAKIISCKRLSSIFDTKIIAYVAKKGKNSAGFIFKNGYIYKGHLKDDIPNGLGIEFISSDVVTVKEGLFKDGNFISRKDD